MKDLEANADAYLDMLSDVVSKPKEEIAKDIRHGRFFDAKEAIEYGLADRIIHSVVDTSIHAVKVFDLFWWFCVRLMLWYRSPEYFANMNVIRMAPCYINIYFFSGNSTRHHTRTWLSPDYNCSNKSPTY